MASLGSWYWRKLTTLTTYQSDHLYTWRPLPFTLLNCHTFSSVISNFLMINSLSLSSFSDLSVTNSLPYWAVESMDVGQKGWQVSWWRERERERERGYVWVHVWLAILQGEFCCGETVKGIVDWSRECRAGVWWHRWLGVSGGRHVCLFWYIDVACLKQDTSAWAW